MSFNAIKGQDVPVAILKAYIENSRLEGGYLFTGPEGIGKKMTALALAEALNCLEAKFDACGYCASCLKIKNNQHPDVHIISSEEPQINPVRSSRISQSNDASNGIKIDAIRQLQKDISLKSYEGGFKFFIIDNAHNMTAEAANCLLKVLEEPPAKSLVILISDKPNLLFKTVISRCKVLKFVPLKRAELEVILKEDYSLDSAFAHFLAYFFEGRLGRALALKEKDILFKKNNTIDKFVLAAKPDIDSLAPENRQEVRASLNLLAAWFRDIYLLKIGMPEQEIINIDRKSELRQCLSRFSFLDLEIILKDISNAILYLGQNVNTRLLLYNLGMDLWKA